jgi:hypothetical protein
LTGSGGSGMNTLGQSSISLDDTYLNNLFKNITRSDYVKRYEVIETTEDVLALSVAWKRLRDNKDKNTHHIGIASLLDDTLFRKVEEPDRVRAIEIRDYFSKKIMLWSLKSIKLSKYRQDLNTFIHGNDKKVTEELLPIVFRLPEFYEYDVKFDIFKREIKLELPTFTSPPLKQLTTLTPVTSFYKSNKRTKQFEYWLKNSNGNAHMIAIEPKNPLKPIWDKMFTNEHLRIEGTYFPKQYDELQYYQLLNWNLV